MMPRMHPSAVLSSGFLLLSTGLSSCTFLPMFSSGGQETPRTLGARMEKHTEVLQKDIGERNASQPKSMDAAAKYIAGNFSDMGYAVTMQPVSGGNVKKGAAIYNILVYKPGLYSNNQSIVVGANYDSSGQRNNGSGTALLLETARGLKDIPTNHNIYFVAYANGAKPAGKSISSGACVHASTLSGSIGATNILGMIDHTDKGDISPFSSLMVALAANIGAGNIIGVGVAIAAGGPGAVFWCWLTGVLGMATRYSEGLLAIKYRVENKDGNMSGGPMFVLERGLNSKWLGAAFAVFTAIAAFGIGNLTQGNAAAEQLHHAFSIPSWGTAAVLTALTALVMLGGIQGIARVCAFFVPFMAVIYIMGCLYILTVQAEYIIPAIRYILDCAFTGEAAAGGAAGAAVMAAMRTGVARGLFSNEAGLGSAAIASAAAQNRNPVRQALISSSGPFWDTVIICALTGIVLTTSIIAHPDISCTDGPKLTTLAFSKIPYIGSPLLTLSLVTFVVSTILGWSYFGEKALEYLGGIRLIDHALPRHLGGGGLHRLRL